MKKSVVVLLHIAYWITYLYLISILLIAFNLYKPGFKLGYVIYNLFCSQAGIAAIIPGLIGFYSHYLFLFEKYLRKKMMLKLLLASLTISFIGFIITNLSLYFIFYYGTRATMYMDIYPLLFMAIFLSAITFIHGVTGLVMKGFIAWYEDIKLKAELDKKNYEMEIALMKAQINPHFLFNTINNIDVLIQSNAVMASDYLNKLSDIMRFMLYETKTEKISLSKELSYIEKYIDLQKIRTSNPNYIEYQVKGHPEDIQIEPMLFIPFIENAFKHAENKKIENAISVVIEIEKDKINFTCSNNTVFNSQSKPEYGGLGNELIEKRLNLLYPKKHTFETTNIDGVYKVNLVISL